MDKFNDMVPTRRSIRDIPLPERSSRPLPPPASRERETPTPPPRIVEEYREQGPRRLEVEDGDHVPPPPPRNSAPKKPHAPFKLHRKSKLLVLGLLAILVIGAAGFLGSLLFSKANVAIKVRSQEIAVNTTLAAQKNLSLGAVSFVPVVKEKTVEVILEPSGQRKVERKATGKIVIYNNYSSSPQRLIKNTRFETPDGLIFRVPETITVPGQTTKVGAVTPGSIEVTVFADTAGDRHNIGLTDFVIPGFKGDPRYDKFYARSSTPMTGGVIGDMKVVSNDILENTEKQLRERGVAELQNELSQSASSTTFIFKESIVVEEEDAIQQEVADGVRVSKVVRLEAPAFNRASLASAIARKQVEGYDGESVELLTPENLRFSFSPQDASLKFMTADAFSFTLEGATILSWIFDEGQLRTDLAGKSKDTMKAVLGGYPSIEEATATFFPFWRGTFPKNSERIQFSITR